MFGRIKMKNEIKLIKNYLVQFNNIIKYFEINAILRDRL
jgi:hypothetical protein